MTRKEDGTVLGLPVCALLCRGMLKPRLPLREVLHVTPCLLHSLLGSLQVW